MRKGGFVYILTNQRKTVLYVGITSNLKSRVWEHAHHEVPASFTSRYNVEFLIYYEWYDDISTAIKREKEIKGWRRAKKETLVQTRNKDWTFLNEEIYKEIYSLLY